MPYDPYQEYLDSLGSYGTPQPGTPEWNAIYNPDGLTTAGIPGVNPTSGVFEPNAPPQVTPTGTNQVYQPPTPPASAAAQGPSAGSISDPGAIQAAWFAWPGHTPGDLAAFLVAHPEFNATIGGSHGQKLIINGQAYDAIDQAGAGGRGKSWLTGGSDAGPAGGAVGGGVAIDPSYLQPFEGAPPQAPGGPSVPNAPDFSYQPFEGFDPWAPTSAEDVFRDPSYQFRLDQGKNALENSAAATGLLNTGGTLKDLIKFGQQFGSQEYGNVDTRRFNVWDTSNRNKLTSYATNRANAADSFATNYGLSTDRYNMLKGQSDDLYNRLWSTYLDDKSTFYQNQDRPVNKLTTLATLGLSAN